jgi:hypothetical protein
MFSFLALSFLGVPSRCVHVCVRVFLSLNIKAQQQQRVFAPRIAKVEV